MASYMQPRSNLGGIARQPFRPGQWQGFKGVSRNTTYIQNNFYGSSVFGANRNYGYYTPQPSYHDCGNNDMPKWMKWMVGIGVGSSLLGGILKLFQKDKPEGGGEVQEPVQTSTPAPVEAPTQAPAQEVTESPETPTGTPTPAEGGDGVKADYAGLNSLNSMVCRDDSGKTTNIEGNFNITEAGADGEPPKSFTITDSSSGTAHEYTYEFTGQYDDNGKPIYTCKSMNGQAASTENQYTLEMKGKDGKPELVQYDGQDNYTKGLKFGSAAPAPTPTQAPGQAQGQAPSAPSIVVTQPPADDSQAPSGPDETPKGQETQAPSYTEKDASQARAMGQGVADDLVGYTNDEEKAHTRKVISSLNSDNIADFLNGYRNNKGLGDNIMRQINTEYGWTNQEKLESQKKILKNLLEKANDMGIKLNSNEQAYCNKFLNINANTTKLSNAAADQLDKIINKLLEEMKPKPGSYGGGQSGGGGAGSTF